MGGGLNEAKSFERTTQLVISPRSVRAGNGGRRGGAREHGEFGDAGARVQLEDTQRLIKFNQAATGDHPTIQQKRIMLERCSKTRRKILSWMEIQTPFMPEVAASRAAVAEQRAEASRLKPVAGDLVQDIPLLCHRHLMWKCHACASCRASSFGCARGRLTKPYHNLRGVRDGMRSNAKIEGIENQITRATATYRVAQKALEVLGARLGEVAWEMVLKVLHDDDVRQMPEGTFRKPGGKGKGKKSKESTGQPLMLIDPAMNEALRIEWARTRALGLRNTEEVDLLEEEMRRTPVYLRWRADWWESQKIHTGKTQRPDLLNDERQREDHDAYATRQAQIMRTIAERFEKKWATIPPLVLTARAEVAVAEAEAAAEESDDGEDGEGGESKDGEGGESKDGEGGETLQGPKNF
ncbi:hypothetical protein DFH09DRAFT_1112085 [Mycena vulgaris]|nr:hypothetical protein DFH09DRAFT_1112085 [Mycena vulgaris]